MKSEIKEKPFASSRNLVKTIVRNANVSEEVVRTAKLFAALDTSMKSTYQSLEKITLGISQIQERNIQILENLHINNSEKQRNRCFFYRTR
ncbi:hypothetical protein G9A89_023506 [Geosiphon pyriformis]|nr:hypothetical protein G9A89_023506 [Geosiphon pyriformis]